MTFELRSAAFVDGTEIPAKYTADGENLSPPLEWSDPPREARSYMLMVEDPDAPGGTFHHWAVYDIPKNAATLPEGTGNHTRARHLNGRNDYGHASYDGPNPPEGHGTHHYHFRLAALDVENLQFESNPEAEDVWRAARPHVIAETELIGTYQR